MPPRIVSLSPAATEMLALIGAEPWMVGRSHECDFPASILTRPVLTGPGPAWGSAEAPSLNSTLDQARLAELRPDLIFTHNLPQARAGPDLTAPDALDSLPSRPRVITLNARTVEGVLDDLLTTGRETGREAESIRAAVELRERLFRAAEFVNPYADGPVVGFLERTDPLSIAGLWTVQLIERAGARHPLNPTTPKPGSGAAAGPQHAEAIAGRSIRVPPDVFAASRPEFLIICPLKLDLEHARPAARALAAAPWFADLPAARTGRIAVVNGRHMFNRPGPRLADALEWLVGWLHHRPELMPPAFPWERL